MIQRRVGAALLAVAALVGAASPSLVAQNKDNKKQTDAQKKDTQAVVKAADDAMTGQPGANDLSAAWVREDFLKALGNKEYVPFTVSVDTSKLVVPTVALYWRVVAKTAAPEAAVAPPAGQKKDDKDKKDSKKSYAYEDISFAPVTPGQSPQRLSRSPALPRRPSRRPAAPPAESTAASRAGSRSACRSTRRRSS